MPKKCPQHFGQAAKILMWFWIAFFIALLAYKLYEAFMAGGEDTPLANGWQGLNRAIAPHLLPPSNSPDTTDAAPSLEAQGLLGPRAGNLLIANKSYNILGVVPMNLPWGRFRTVATADGTRSNAAVPWPSTVSVTLPGWVLVTPGALTASQTGVGTTNGTAKTLSTAVDLSAYGDRVYYKFQGTNTISVVAGESVTGKVQGLIDAGWQDLYSFTADDSTAPMSITEAESLYSYTSGSLTQLRAVCVKNSGAGAATVTFRPALYFLNGILRTTITAS